MAPQAASARLRSAPSANVVVRIDSVTGATTAPPRPWTRAGDDRAGPGPGESPPASEASANSSEAGDEHPALAEQVGGAAAQQQEAGEGQRVGVDDPLQVDGREARGPSRIDGSATFTTETSRITMNCARQQRIRIQRLVAASRSPCTSKDISRCGIPAPDKDETTLTVRTGTNGVWCLL